MNPATDYTQQNGHDWDEIAEIRDKQFPDADYFLQGGCTILQNVQDVVGSVQGCSLLHLQCATGADTISWSTLGADAVGVDISPKERGRNKTGNLLARVPPDFPEEVKNSFDSEPVPDLFREV